ncbi:ABC transporter permease [Nocardioides speluncae]|uniref:ABC transporter permease n=1 Tax=Nocardioides speluncae TaxID=2670337 RepID=UPI000D69712A|nr:ABC transporter permease [Nocardioides speluncae]
MSAPSPSAPLVEEVAQQPSRNQGAAALAAQHGLTRIGGRPRLSAYLKDLWQRRHFALKLGSSRAYARNQDSFLGQLWAVLTPLLWAGVYLFVFGVLLKTDRGVENFAGFLVIGVFLFRFTASSISAGAKAITGNSSLISSLQFPRALLPIAVVVAEFVALLPELVVLAALVLVTGEPVRVQWLLLLVAVGLQLLFSLGVAFIVARAVAEIRDVGNLIPFVIRALMYVSGVFFSIDHYAGGGLLGDILTHNPMAIYLELGRASLLEGQSVGLDIWAWGAGFAVVTLVGGFLYFWHGEEKYGRV